MKPQVLFVKDFRPYMALAYRVHGNRLCVGASATRVGKRWKCVLQWMKKPTETIAGSFYELWPRIKTLPKGVKTS